MLIASGFSWFHLFPGAETEGFLGGTAYLDGHAYGYVFLSACFASLLIIGFALMARAGLNKAMARQGIEKYHADESLTPLVVAAGIIGALMGLMGALMDKKSATAFLPLIAGLFTYIFVCNILAIFPGFQPPTDNINTNIGMALIVMVTYMVVGLALDGKGFIQHMMGPVLPLVPLFLVLELISYLAVRPGSLAVRLTGNLFGDHTVFNIMSQLSAELLFYAPVPVIFLALATLVSLIQAGVFSLLTSIYISQSLPHGDHHDH